MSTTNNLVGVQGKVISVSVLVTPNIMEMAFLFAIIYFLIILS